jgi:UDP-glucose 4-epimerase
VGSTLAQRRTSVSVLVTGGAGYIGSVVVEELLAAGRSVVVLDDLSSGHAQAVSAPARLIEGDFGDRTLVSRLCREHDVVAAIHLAAISLVQQSVHQPERYHEHNVARSCAFVEALLGASVRRVVFSSSASVYASKEELLTEDAVIAPSNPYGETKWAFECALRAYAESDALRHASLRYFNAAGATSAHGEVHDPETHLIPIVLDVARGRRASITIHGDDYATPDGTCIRDYVHVRDLARAHLLALDVMDRHQGQTYNLGTGRGYSVREVIEAARRVTGRAIPAVIGARRPGDPARLVASAELIHRELRWRAERSGIAQIIGDAWSWLERNPDGYRPA